MEDSEIDLHAILDLLRRRFRLIALVFFVAIAAAVIALFLLTPIYSASTLVLVDPSKKNLLVSEVQSSSSSADSARVDSEAEILRSGSTLLNVIAEKQLVFDPEFGVQLGMRDKVMTWLRLSDGVLPSGEEALQHVLANFKSAVSVSRRGLTYILAIQVRSKDPHKAADLANTIARSYIRDQLDVKINSVLASRDILEGRISQAGTAIADSENAFDDFIFGNIDRIVTETGNLEFANLRGELRAVDLRREEVIDLADLVDRDIQQADWTSLVTSLQGDALQALEAQRAELSVRIEQTTQGASELVDLQAELARIEEEMSQTAGEELSRLRAEIIETQHSSSNLRQQIRSTALSSDLPAEILTGIYERQQNAGVARTQYQALLLRFRELETQADLQVADSRIVAPALSPAAPSFPNTRLILALAGLAGLGLGVGLAFLNEHFVGGFANEAQVRAVLRANVLASVPKLRGTKSGTDKFAPLADTMVEAPLSVYAESVRRVRASIDQMMRQKREVTGGKPPPKKGTVIMVGSAVPNEGKTTIALSLARAYALSGQRALLIDSDLRKPGVHRQLSMEASDGLLEYLSEGETTASLSGILSQDSETGLDVIRGSRHSDMPTDQLLTGQRFSTLIESATKHYDVVILDTPPLGPVVDGLYLAPHADVMVLVIRWAHTSQSDVRSALLRLEQTRRADAEIVAVLNQQEGGSAYGGDYYGYSDQSY